MEAIEFWDTTATAGQREHGLRWSPLIEVHPSVAVVVLFAGPDP
jgi:hypothetical protein